MKTKKEFRYFTIFNHQKEEAYLRQRHKEGWRFVKVSGFGIYHFEECTPEDVVYQLDYNPQKKKQKEEYIKIFGDCGWEYIQDYVDYSYFRKSADAMQGEEGIFNDDESRLAMMSRVYRGRMFPLVGILCACLLPQLILNIINGIYWLATLIGAIVLTYLVLFVASAISYYRFKNK